MAPRREGSLDRLLKSLDEWIARQVDPADRLGVLRSQVNEFGYGPFGLNLEMVRRTLLPAAFIYRNYFRTEVFDIENVPAEGRVFLVANHSGQLPIDGSMIITACLLDRDPPRIVRSMVEVWVPTLPFISYFFSRVGQIVGTPENCLYLLGQGEAILVFPEGTKGISKTFDKRYQLQEFGLGFMRLALETDTPIVPVAVIGAEEQAPSFLNLRSLGKIFGAPAFPVTPTFPWLFPLGALPYPVRYRLHFGEPLHFEGDPNDEDSVIESKVKVVQNTLQQMIKEGLKRRRHIFW